MLVARVENCGDFNVTEASASEVKRLWMAERFINHTFVIESLTIVKTADIFWNKSKEFRS